MELLRLRNNWIGGTLPPPGRPTFQVFHSAEWPTEKVDGGGCQGQKPAAGRGAKGAGEVLVQVRLRRTECDYGVRSTECGCGCGDTGATTKYGVRCTYLSTPSGAHQPKPPKRLSSFSLDGEKLETEADTFGFLGRNLTVFKPKRPRKTESFSNVSPFQAPSRLRLVKNLKGGKPPSASISLRYHDT